MAIILPEERCERVHQDEGDPYDAVAAERGEHALKVRPGDVRLHLERRYREVTDVVRTESCKFKKCNRNIDLLFKLSYQKPE